MDNNKDKNKALHLLLLIVGIILLLFSSTFIFTMPSLFSGFDFRETGQIGDTIGGITAPIINLIGAILVYLSFRVQNKANEIQYELLNKEIENQNRDRNFQVSIELFNEIKSDYKNLNIESTQKPDHIFHGQSALNVYVNRIDASEKEEIEDLIRKPIYHEWQYILCELDLLLTHIKKSEFKSGEKDTLYLLIKKYYITQLEYASDTLYRNLKENNLGNESIKLIEMTRESLNIKSD